MAVASVFKVPTQHNSADRCFPSDHQPFQDTFLNVILKSWITVDATASQTARHVQVAPSLSVSAGDYLVFIIMSGGEVIVDAEMQVILVFPQQKTKGPMQAFPVCTGPLARVSVTSDADYSPGF